MSLTQEKKAELIEKFGDSPQDTGKTEVQVALLTRAHQRADRAPAHPQEGPPLASRPADARRTASPLSQLPAAQGSRALPGTGQRARPAQVSPLPAGTAVPPFSLNAGSDRKFTDADLHGVSHCAGLLPVRVQPRLHRPAEPLRRAARRVRGARGDALRRLLRLGLVAGGLQEQLGIEIEQLSDFEPKGVTCRALGVYHPGGFPQRALMIVGPDATVQWSYQAASPG